MPPPSSLIFVAIVVAWGAYLLPRWVSRRDALGQARGLDRFSGDLRVLSRRGRPRPVGPSTTALLTTPATGSATAPATTPAGSVAALVPATADQVVAARGAKVADRARTAAATAARRRRRVLTVCLTLAVLGWAAVALEVVAWQVAAGVTVLLPVDLVALAVSARIRAGRRRVAARAVAREVARADRWRQVHEQQESTERDELRGRHEIAASVPAGAGTVRTEARDGRYVTVGAELHARLRTAAVDPGIDRDADTAELDLRPVAADRAAAVPPPWPVDPADGVMLDDGPVGTGSIPVWALMTAAAAAAAAAAPGGDSETAPGWPQVERRVRDRRALRRPTPDRRAAENVGSGRRLAAVNQVEGSWQPVAVPLPMYTMKSQAPRASATRGADGIEPEVAVRPGAARAWQPERPGGEAVDLDEVLARRRAVNG